MKEDPAVTLVRNWHTTMGLVVDGVDFGKVVEYDALQIVNRSILSHPRQKEEAEKNVGNQEAGDIHVGQPHDTAVVEAPE